MQSDGGGNGGGRNPSGWPPASSTAPPTSSSSTVSGQQLGFDSSSQQLLQQQFYRKSEGNESLLAYQAGGLPGIAGGSNFFPSTGTAQLPQHYRKFDGTSTQHCSAEDGQSRRQGGAQQMQNPMQHARFPFAFQTPAKSAAMSQLPQQSRLEMAGPSSGKDQDIGIGSFRRQEAMTDLTANETQASSSNASGEKQLRHMLQPMADQRNEMRQMMHPSALGPFSRASNVKPPQSMQAQQFTQSMSNNQMALAAQMQALARENNIDLSVPANANMMIKLMPLLQARMAAQQKANEDSVGVSSKPPVASPSGTNVGSPHVNSPGEVSMVSNSSKTVHSAPPSSSSVPGAVKYNNNPTMQQFSPNGRENQASGKSVAVESGKLPMSSSQPAMNATQVVNQSYQVKTELAGAEASQGHYPRQLNQSPVQSSVPSRDGGSSSNVPHQVGVPQQRSAFTKQQLHVLKAQILAFRRIKKGEGTLPQELLEAISPPPLELQQPHQHQQQQQFLPGGANTEDKSVAKTAEHVHKHLDSADNDGRPVPPAKKLETTHLREEVAGTEEKPTSSPVQMKDLSADVTEHKAMDTARKEEHHDATPSAESGKIAVNRPVGNDSLVDKGRTAESLAPTCDAVQGNNAQSSSASCQRDVGATRKYAGPLFDFPVFTRKHDSFGSAMMVNGNNNLTLAYNVKDLVSEEGLEVLNRRRTENLKKIGGLLAVNLERKRIRPDLVLRLQIEEKKLRLLDIQARLRDEVDNAQQDIMAMPDRPYRKFVRLCERQRVELTRQVQSSQKAAREKQLKSIFQWRKKLLEAHWVIRDARIARNRGVAKYHEKMLKEFSKTKDDDRNKRMEALKNNDVERYREMLLEQQTNISGDAAERYNVLSTFLTQTEEYLQKLGGKITAAKTHQEVEEAANAAAMAARLQGLSEEEVRTAAACAGEEVMIRHQFVEMNAPKDGSYVNKYYNLAHAVNERVVKQPSMLRLGTLRDYQIVGLQWMLSLYNNKLNGILADEMGLGKTVQVMALIAYLMEFKGNNGPHLIIVPNAVLVNWKSELHNWLPSVSCIFYVGGKDQRSKLFSQEVAALKFNVLVTTYEFIMFDRAKLSKVDWKYIIIDEAQRMKDRESVLARDLDRYRCQRRLLLTGTPLQNDLKELWSLLNLLLPEVFDNKKVFHDWFSKPFQKEGSTPDGEDDWLETEKKVIIIHRLHQILEPFMLRRRVEDVEGSLPPKVSIVLRCRMSAFQSAIYDWIKSTGTLRIDPEDEKLRAQKSSLYQSRTYKTLNNRCMELRKVCNHPLLSYPYFSDLSKEFLVKSCGKLWVLDRILMKLHRTGHRVLLFSTMTKLLDIMEEYLQWRRLVYRRIDGTTSLEERESAIVDFNSPDSDCFIFLLSIRAAGRGLNLQSADTVVIYDPDPNPKNEEQAVARAHRIGQTREVKVIYLEAVVDKMSIHQKEDELRSGGKLDSEDDDLAGKDRYMGSIESLIRNNIQQYKIDMADEVINAGRFDQRTTHEERRLTLETLLHDEERYQENVHNVPSLQEVNRMIARSEEEVELFDQMDEELDWVDEMTIHEEVPKWLRAGSKEVNGAVAALSKKPSKSIAISSDVERESNDVGSKRKRGRPKGKNYYRELDDDDDEYLEASSDDGNKEEEEGEVEESEDDEFQGSGGALPVNKEPSEEEEEEDRTAEAGKAAYLWETERTGNNHVLEQATSSGSSAASRRLRVMSPVSSQKFGSLSALESRPPSSSKRMGDDLEEGEIAISGDPRMNRSGSLIHDNDEAEDEHILQPKIRRKRSIRMRPRHALEKQEKSGDVTPTDSPTMPFHMDHKHQSNMRNDTEASTFIEPETPVSRQGQTVPSLKSRRLMSSRRGRLSHTNVPADAADEFEEDRDSRVTASRDISSSRGQMSDAIQRKCKNAVSKLQRRIDKEGDEVIPVLTDLWRRTESSGTGGYLNTAAQHLLTLRKIEGRVDKLEYDGVMDLVFDIQSMLKGAMQHFGFSKEVRSEAAKVHELFFDILKIAFPDLDFREARTSISFAAPSGPASSSRPNPPQKPQLRRLATAPSSEEGTRIRVQLPPRKETGPADDSPHPGELVICKKKRKEREKTVGRIGAGPDSSSGRATRSSLQVTTRLQGLGNSGNSHGGGGASVGWANPVKRLRSDSGRRRPSHF